MMMTLNEEILGEAKTARDRLLELQHEAERAQADFQHAVRRLHAAGGSMREIGESLSLSHQRVHQIVDTATPGTAREERWGPVRRARRGVREAFARFTADARRIVVDAQEEASALGHGFVGTEHLLLALLRGGGPGTATITAAGTTYDTARERIVAEVGEGPGHGGRRGRFRFTPAAKRTLEHALQEAKALGDRHIGSEHVLLGLLSSRGLGAEILGDPDEVRTAVLGELGRA
jgi:hypothetical protein